MNEAIKKVKLGFVPLMIIFFIMGCIPFGKLINDMVSVFSGQETFHEWFMRGLQTYILMRRIFFWLLWWMTSGIFLYAALTFDKKIRQYCQENNAWHKVEQFYTDTTPICADLRISDEFILGIAKNDILFAPTEELLWVYMKVFNVKQAAVVTVARDYSVVFCTKDGKMQNYILRGESQALMVMDYIKRSFPWIIIGYSEELEKTFRYDRQSMIREVKERRLSF